MRIKRTHRRKKIVKSGSSSEIQFNEKLQTSSYKLVKLQPECSLEKNVLESFDTEYNVSGRIKDKLLEMVPNEFSNIGNVTDVTHDKYGCYIQKYDMRQTDVLVSNIKNVIQNSSGLCPDSSYVIKDTTLSVIPASTKCSSSCTPESSFVFVPVPTQSCDTDDTDETQYVNIRPQDNTDIPPNYRKDMYSDDEDKLVNTDLENTTADSQPYPKKIQERLSDNKKLYFCKQCSYKCKRLNHLIVHERIHTGEKPYACDKCNYRSTQMGHLKIHLRTHTGEKPFYCDQCSYKSSQLGHLKLHKANHTGEKPFACDVCSYRCCQLSDLKVHKRRHTGGTLFSCNKCKYQCSSATYIEKHKIIHTSEKAPFGNKQKHKSKQSNNFKVHRKFHTVYVQSYETPS